MASITLTEDTDIVTSKIVKEDDNNTDEMTLFVPGDSIIAIGDTITYRDNTPSTIFKGIVQNIKITNGDKEIKVYDLGAELLQRNINTTYNSMSPEAIISSVISTYTTLSYVSTISSGITIDSYTAKEKRAWDVVTEMSEILLANFYVDVDGNFNLEFEGQNNSSKSISSDNALLTGPWEYDISQQVNSITVEGEDRQFFEADPEFFNGTGSQTEFTLSEIPIDVKVEHPISTVKTPYVRGSSTGDYYVDRENKKIVFDTAPSSGSNNIKVYYTYSIPIKVRRRDFSSISAYGQKDKVVRKPYIKTREEARQVCDKILTRFSEPLQSSTWTIMNATDYNDFASYVPNEFIQVNDSLNNINGAFIIRKVIREQGVLKITVGDPTDDIINWNKEVQQRVKQLEEKDDNSDLLNEDEQIINNLNVTVKSQIITFQKKPIDDGFVLDSSALDGPDILDGADDQDWTTIWQSKFPMSFPFSLE